MERPNSFSARGKIEVFRSLSGEFFDISGYKIIEAFRPPPAPHRLFGPACRDAFARG
jgi:hypothetical protein